MQQRKCCLDEPVAGLDPEASEAMYQMIRKLNKEHKITIFMISHDINKFFSYTVCQIDGDNNKYCRLANAVIK